MALPLYVNPAILAKPAGSYSISYELNTRAIEDDLPNGWHARSADVHSRIIRYLNMWGFNRTRDSVYTNPNTTAIATYRVMTQLRWHLPPSMLATIADGLRMKYTSDPQVLDITHEIAPGGLFSPTLLEPTPAALDADAPLQVPSSGVAILPHKEHGPH